MLRISENSISSAHVFLVGALLEPNPKFMEVKTRNAGASGQYVWRSNPNSGDPVRM